MNRAMMVLLSLIGLTLAIVGCQKSEDKPKKAKKDDAGSGGGGGGAAVASGGGAIEAKAFNATIKGRVTYNGDGTPVVDMGDVDKANQDKGCPAKIMKSGWYTDKSSDKKGVRYAVVFIRPTGGMKMPKLSDDQLKPPAGKEVLQMDQPKCQFEPRVVVLGPKQDMRFRNDSSPGMSHDANLSGPGSYSKTLPAGTDVVYKDIETSDTQPYKVSCNQHSAFMSAYVWKFRHPFAAVTDDEGNFEIKNVPVPGNGKFELVVWHEMLPSPNTKVVKELDIKDGGTVTETVAIPK